MKFVIYGRPMTKSNHLRIGRSRTGKPFVMQAKTSVKWQNDAALQLQSQMRKYRGSTFHAGQRWNLCALFYRERNHAGDVGNYLKGLCDALATAGVVANDRQIAGHDGSRLLVDSRIPRVEITLTPL